MSAGGFWIVLSGRYTPLPLPDRFDNGAGVSQRRQVQYPLRKNT
jgi:hypothetical protein